VTVYPWFILQSFVCNIDIILSHPHCSPHRLVLVL